MCINDVNNKDEPKKEDCEDNIRQIYKNEYESVMNRFAKKVKEERESSIIGIANDIFEELNTSQECQIEFKLGNIHIGDAYVTMEAVCCMLYSRNVCISYTIDVGNKTEGTEEDERAGQSICEYTLYVSVYAFNDNK